MKALAIAATGMNAQQTNLEVIANNIANINTTGFKRARAEFADLLYQTERTAGRADPRQCQHRAGRRHDRPRRQDGRRAQRPYPGHADGDRQQLRPGAERPRLVPGRGRGRLRPVYTRAGAFNTNADGQLVTARRLRGLARHHRALGRRRGHRQQDRAGLRPDRRPDGPAEPRPADASPTSPTRPDWRRRATICSPRPPPPARRSSACPAIPATPRSSRAIWKAPTSTRSRKSPS